VRIDLRFQEFKFIYKFVVFDLLAPGLQFKPASSKTKHPHENGDEYGVKRKLNNVKGSVVVSFMYVERLHNVTLKMDACENQNSKWNYKFHQILPGFLML